MLVFPGSNCDRDAEEALRTAVPGIDVERVWHEGATLDGVDLCILPGGFAHGDYLRAGALAARSPALSAVRGLIARGGRVLGICNGFQVLVEAGILPGAFRPNTSQHFVCRDVHVRVAEGLSSPLLSGLEGGSVLLLPVAHGEGNWRAEPEELLQLERRGQVALRYCDAFGAVRSEDNPNGSSGNVAGVLDESGRVLGLMPHPERAAWPELGRADGIRLLQSFALGALVRR